MANTTKPRTDLRLSSGLNPTEATGLSRPLKRSIDALALVLVIAIAVALWTLSWIRGAEYTFVEGTKYVDQVSPGLLSLLNGNWGGFATVASVVVLAGVFTTIVLAFWTLILPDSREYPKRLGTALAGFTAFFFAVLIHFNFSRELSEVHGVGYGLLAILLGFLALIALESWVLRRVLPNIKLRHLTEKIAFTILWIAGSLAIIALVFVVYHVFKEGFGEVIQPDFLTTPPRGGLEAEGGISTTIGTTIYLVILTIIVATPLGVLAAVYLVEYAGEMRGQRGVIPFLVGVVRFGVETLAGVPSIIFGLFGYALFVTTLKFGFSLLSASLAGAALILPVIIRTTEEALLTVPKSYREGSLALGTTQWQTVWSVVLPAALPGIITGIVLSVGRIVSETAVFYVTLGGSSRLPNSLLASGRTMALHLYYLAQDTNAPKKAMATGIVLVVSIILINLAINFLSNRLRKKFRG